MSKKGRLKIEHLSLKGGEQSKRRNKHPVITITSQCMDDYNVIKQTILKQNNAVNAQCLRPIGELLDQFIHAKSLRQQIESFKRLVKVNWSETEACALIACALFKLCLSLTLCPLNRDFIQILCRLLDKLHDKHKQLDYSSTVLPILDCMMDKPQLYHIATLSKFLSCHFMRNCTDSVTIWCILKLLNTLLNALVLDHNNECLLGRDIIGAFWLFITNHSTCISSLFTTVTHPSNIAIMTALFKTCHQLLCNASFHKDVITKVAFLYHVLITYCIMDYKQQTQCFSRITNAIHDANVNTKPKTPQQTIMIELQNTLVITADWHTPCTLSKIGFIRAIITQSHIDVLKCELIDMCYDILMNDWCVTIAKQNAVTTLYLLDTICAWITSMHKILLLTCTNDIQLQTKLRMECIHNVIQSNWNHPTRAVAFVIETMYTKYITIMDELNDDINWMKHVQEAMRLPMGEQGKYLRLKVLMKRVGAMNIFTEYPNWIMILLEASCVVGGIALNLITESLNLAKHKLKSEDVSRWRNLWLDAMCKGFVHSNASVRKATNTELLKYVMAADAASYFPLIEHILQQDEVNTHALIGILKCGKRNGIISNQMMEEWLNDEDSARDNEYLNHDWIFGCLLHEETKIRMETLDLICASKQSTDIPGAHQLQVLRTVLPYLMCMQQSRDRDRFVRQIQKLMLRIKNGCYKILHTAHKRAQSTHTSDLLAVLDSDNHSCIINCLDFVEWFRTFLLDNLYPAAAMERVSTAITLYYFVLHIWTDKKQNETEYEMLQIPLLGHDAYLTDVLLNCMMNSRDQIRLLSAKILKTLTTPYLPGYQSEVSVIGLVRRCLILSTSPRLLESDCGAFMLSLIFDKYTKLQRWSFDLSAIFNEDPSVIQTHSNAEQAMLSFLSSFNEILRKHIASISVLPFHERYRSAHDRVHGLLTFLRQMMSHFDFEMHLKEEWKQILAAILQNVFQIGQLSLVLHTRNPQQKDVEKTRRLVGIDCRGHMMFEANYVDQQSEQMIVVSSWLSVKESCLCLAQFIQHCPHWIWTQDIRAIGAFFIDTLQTTRHNGVIEKAHAAFTIVCRTLLASDVSHLPDLVRQWLDELLNIIRNDAAQHWIRRSAGFPFSVLAILEAESKIAGSNDHTLFEYTVQSLLIEAAADAEWQSKVVSLNVLMCIFRNASFNVSVRQFVSRAFRIVLPGFAHTEWAVRNSSMLCLSAVLSRAIHKADVNAEHAGEIFFAQNPDLHSYLLQHLRDASDDDSNMHPSLFPVLLVLSKLSGGGERMRAFQSNVMKCASHKYERVRIMSARALTCLLSKQELIPFVRELISQLPCNMKQVCSMNALHGLLLQIEFILRDADHDMEEIVPILSTKLWILNCIQIACVVQQVLISICYHLVHKRRASARFLMAIYRNSLAVLSTTNSELQIGKRRLRSFASKILIETLLLSSQCSMNGACLTQLICVMLKDSDEVVVEATAKCLCSVVINNDCDAAAAMDWQKIFAICMTLVNCKLKRRLASVIQLLQRVIKIVDITDVCSIWNAIHSIAMNNCHFVVQIAAMQCLGSIIAITNDRTIIKNWIGILNKVSEEDTAEELRSVCVSSIEASRILEKDIEMPLIQVDIWLIMIRLLQDFELPIRNDAATYICKILHGQTRFVSNYCIHLVFDHLCEHFMSPHLLQKVLQFILHPNVAFYTEWVQSQSHEYQLFLPERPNNSFEPLLTMQMATNLFVKQCDADDILNFVNSNVIHVILAKMQNINDKMDHDRKIKILDAQMQLICTLWMTHWLSLFYCHKIISACNRHVPLSALICNKLKSTLQAFKAKLPKNNIIIAFCQKHLKRTSNHSQSDLFLL